MMWNLNLFKKYQVRKELLSIERSFKCKSTNIYNEKRANASFSPASAFIPNALIALNERCCET